MRDWPVSDNHHVGVGSYRGLAFDAFVYGWRVAVAWYDADYWRGMR